MAEVTGSGLPGGADARGAVSAGSPRSGGFSGSPAAGEPESPTRSHLGENLRVYATNRFALAGAIFLVFSILFSFLGPLLYRTNQVAANLLIGSQPPSAVHLLGTNPEGFDILGRLMVGGQSTLEVAFAVAALATTFGALWGAIAGFLGGFADSFLMRIVDAMLSIPFLFFVVLLAALVQPSLPIIIVAIASVSWLSTARLVRGEVLSLRTRDYVAAARTFGEGTWKIIFLHLLPNSLGVVVVNATLKVADAILTFAAISFLGLGVPPPATSWGQMLTTGISNLFDGYWWQLWPAAGLIVLSVIAINVMGDGLRDVVESRLQTR
ncbi:MAG: ABC transporter permease [Candidatus Dormibacteria bacterium]